LELLDAFAGNHDLLEQVRTCARRWGDIAARQRALTGGEDRQQHIELLRHELDALQQWALAPDALTELENDHRRLANADRLLEGCQNISELIDGDSDQASQPLLARIQTELEHLSALDDRLQPVLELVANAGIQLGEADSALGHYARDIDPVRQRYDEIDGHLSHPHELSRR